MRSIASLKTATTSNWRAVVAGRMRPAEQGELSAELAASTTLGGLLDKLRAFGGTGRGAEARGQFDFAGGHHQGDWLDCANCPKQAGCTGVFDNADNANHADASSIKDFGVHGRARKGR